VPGGAKYRADIDGLRAIAVLAVLAFHAFPGVLPGGFVGVDVFFVISGFLITGILISALQRGTFTFADFYSRRARRIFPALVVVLAACWLFGWFALFPDEYEQLGRHILGGAGFVANIVFWRESGYFDNAAETKPLLHLWSLGVEEQFYFVWPLLLAFCARRGVSYRRVLAGLALVSFAINVAFVHRFPTATFYSPLGRAWELALGALLAVERRPTARAADEGAMAAATRPRGALDRADLASLAGLAGIVGACVGLSEKSAFPGFWALAPTVGTALVLRAGPTALVNRWLLARRWMVGCGLISYPLYLWHWPLLTFARIVESKTPAIGLRFALLAAAFVLSALTFRWVEKPIRFGGGVRRKLAALCAAMVALAAVGRWTAADDGLAWRPTVEDNYRLQRALNLVEDKLNAEACEARYSFSSSVQYCLLDQPAKEPTVALVGDSHAFHLVAGLSAYYRERGDNLLYLGTRIPFWGVPVKEGDGYQAATDGMLELALRTPGIHTVLISTAWKPNRRTLEDRRLVALLRLTLERFVAGGKRVIYLEDVPQLDFEPRACIPRVAISSSATRSPCAVPRAELDAATAESRAVLEDILRQVPAVEAFDPTATLCDAEWCRVIRDGQLLYRDTNHLSLDGDLLVGRAFGVWRDGRRR